VVKCGQRKGARLAVCRRSEWRPADPQSVNLLYPSQAGISLPAAYSTRLTLVEPFLVLLYRRLHALKPFTGASSLPSTDQSGAALTGTRMTITSVQKGSKVETTTNAAGNYGVIHLIPDQLQCSLRGRWIQSCRIHECSRVCGPGGESRRKTTGWNEPGRVNGLRRKRCR